MLKLSTPTRRSINGELMDVSAAASFLGMTEKALRHNLELNRVPFRKLGCRIVFRRSDLEQWLEGLEVGCSVQEAVARGNK